ncbi:MAG: glycerate kinase family protein [Angustibacter sp.]
MSDTARVVVAPDSFKGSCPAHEAARALAQGWLSQRPGDDVRLRPLADGGEGTLEVMAAAVPGSRVVAAGPVRGPLGEPTPGRYLRLPDGTAVVELAVASGLHLVDRLDPLRASTFGTGQIIARALGSNPSRLVLAVGGSATTDGGSGLLQALGLRADDPQGRPVPSGGAGLLRLERVDAGALVAPPAGGVEVLVDVINPLLGPGGAAAVFAPQKGADPQDVATLERGLARWAELSGGDPQAAGAGAAGGTAYGVATWWGARLVPGADQVADLVDLDAELAAADVVVTGEGRFDATSLGGKVVGTVLRRAGRCAADALVVCGQVDTDPAVDGAAAPQVLALADLAGDPEASMADPLRWLQEAGARLARARSSREG